MSWYQYAACRGQNPELFFPIGTGGPAVQQLQEAKAVCGRCAVQSVCLEWALLARIDDGVWGGLSEDERRSLNRRTTRQRGRVLNSS
jgi:WhiB family redox-sensing transcriptional regulator